MYHTVSYMFPSSKTKNEVERFRRIEIVDKLITTSWFPVENDNFEQLLESSDLDALGLSQKYMLKV